MVSVSCFAGSGPFCVNGAEIRQEDAGAVSAESESELRHTHINWWICPTGGFSDKERVQLLVDEFEEAYPQIDVDYRILDEVTGPGEIRTALERRLPEAGEASDAGDLSDEGKPDSKDSPDAGKSDSKDSPDEGKPDSKDSPDAGKPEVRDPSDTGEPDAQDSPEEGEPSDREALPGQEDSPDVILAAPEYLVTQWGREGLMADLSDLWDEETQSEFRTEMKDAVRSREGVWYAVPLFRDLYTMAINYDLFAEAGALQYLNEEVHSWKDSGFIDAVLRIHDHLEQSGRENSVAGRVYCKDKAGQRAFMSFVSNFLNTGIVDEYHSSYQLEKGNVRSVFGTLMKMVGKGIEFDAEMNGDEENEAFLNQDVFLTFNWSAGKQQAAQDLDFRVFPMMYPNSKNLPALTGPVGALGVVRTKDKEKEDAAVSFVRFFMMDENAYVDTVKTSGCFPARRRIGNNELKLLYGTDQTMQLYEVFNDYYDDYVPVMELFDQLEEEWPEMIRMIADGKKIKSVMKEENRKLNTALEERYGIRPISMEGEEE